MDFKARIKKFWIIALLTASPLTLIGILALSGISFDQMILFVGLEVNEQSVMVFVLIALMNATLLLFTKLTILCLYMREGAIKYAERMAIKEPHRKEFWDDMKKLAE